MIKNSAKWADTVFVEGLELSCCGGETPEERAFPQIIRISAHLTLDLRRAGRSDDIRDTMNYAGFIEHVKGALEGKKFSLVETIAELIAQIALADTRVAQVKIKVGKKSFPDID